MLYSQDCYCSFAEGTNNLFGTATQLPKAKKLVSQPGRQPQGASVGPDSDAGSAQRRDTVLTLPLTQRCGRRTRAWAHSGTSRASGWETTGSERGQPARPHLAVAVRQRRFQVISRNEGRAAKRGSLLWANTLPGESDAAMTRN